MSNTDAKVRERREAAEKLKKRNQRRQKNNVNVYFWKKFAGIAVACLCGLLVLALIIPNFSFVHRITPAMKVGDKTISATEFSYAYQSQFWSYYQETYEQYYYYYYYMTGSTPSSSTIQSMMPIDLYTSLEKQEMSDGKTYAEYFRDLTVDTLHNVYALYQDAIKNGKSLTEEQQATIDEEIADLKESAEEAEYTSFDNYLAQNFGKGLNEKILRSYMEIYSVANDWATEVRDGYTYTDEEVEAYYTENADTYDSLSIRYLLFTPTDQAEKEIADAKAEAEEFLNGVSTEADYSAKALEKAKSESDDPDSVTSESTAHTDLNVASFKSSYGELGEWAADAERKAGDMAVVECVDEDDGDVTYYACYMVETRHRDENRVVEVNHLLITPEDEDNEDEATLIMAQLQDLMDELKAEATDGKVTVEEFLSLVNTYAEDDDRCTVEELGEVEEGETVTAFNDWIFDSSRVAGDMGIVETSYGYHLIYFIDDAGVCWSNDVDDDMRTEDYSEYQTERKAEYPATTYWLGTDALRDEPLPY